MTISEQMCCAIFIPNTVIVETDGMDKNMYYRVTTSIMGRQLAHSLSLLLSIKFLFKPRVVYVHHKPPFHLSARKVLQAEKLSSRSRPPPSLRLRCKAVCALMTRVAVGVSGWAPSREVQIIVRGGGGRFCKKKKKKGCNIMHENIRLAEFLICLITEHPGLTVASTQTVPSPTAVKICWLATRDVLHFAATLW